MRSHCLIIYVVLANFIEGDFKKINLLQVGEM